MARKRTARGARRREFEEGLRLALAGWQGCIEWRGSTNNWGYGLLGVGGKTQYVHRLAWEAANGPVPAGMELDHVCHNRRCFNPTHLRLATGTQNKVYAPKYKSGRSSRFKGVCRHNRANPWRAQIKISNKRIHLGYFPTEEAAARAYDEAALTYFGEFAWLNFPKGA